MDYLAHSPHAQDILKGLFRSSEARMRRMTLTNEVSSLEQA